MPWAFPFLVCLFWKKLWVRNILTSYLLYGFTYTTWNYGSSSSQFWKDYDLYALSFFPTKVYFSTCISRRPWRLMMVWAEENTLLVLDKIACHFVQRWKMSSQWGNYCYLNLQCCHMLLLVANDRLLSCKDIFLSPLAIFLVQVVVIPF